MTMPSKAYRKLEQRVAELEDELSAARWELAQQDPNNVMAQGVEVLVRIAEALEKREA